VSRARVDAVSVAGGKMDVNVWLPVNGRGPALELVPAIFGLSAHVRSVAERLTAAGYVVAVPDLFWRFAPGWVAQVDEAGLSASLATAGQLDRDLAVDDCAAVLAHLGGCGEVERTPGIIGFCLGGTLAFATAVHGDPSVCVSYYGSSVPDLIDAVDDVTCPTLFHFGSRDPSIPGAAIERVAATTAGRSHLVLNVEIAGHAFDDEAPMFSDVGAARSAWSKTTAFLAEHLPVPSSAER
jgi:carboxymethylenebutenolidase